MPQSADVEEEEAVPPSTTEPSARELARGQEGEAVPPSTTEPSARELASIHAVARRPGCVPGAAAAPAAGYLSAFYVGTDTLWVGLASSAAHRARGFSCASCGATPIVGDRYLAAENDAHGRRLNFCTACVTGSGQDDRPRMSPISITETFGPLQKCAPQGRAHHADNVAMNDAVHTLSQLQWTVLRLVLATCSHDRLGESAWTVGADMDVIVMVGNRLLSIAQARLPGRVWTVARSGDAALLAAHLELGADVNDANHADAMNPTPLFVASRHGHLAVTEVLLDRKADVTVQNCRASECLMVAAQSGHAKIVARLLRTPVNIDLSNYEGSTSLSMAAQNGHLETVKLLVQGGANTIHRCKGRTPAAWAARFHHVAIVEYLAQSRGVPQTPSEQSLARGHDQ